MAGSVVARPVLSDSKLRHCGDVRPVYSRSCSSEGGHQRLRMRGIGHVQRLRSRDGYQRPTVHGCRPPCVYESTGAGITALPDTCGGQALGSGETQGEAPCGAPSTHFQRGTLCEGGRSVLWTSAFRSVSCCPCGRYSILNLES